MNADASSPLAPTGSYPDLTGARAAGQETTDLREPSDVPAPEVELRAGSEPIPGYRLEKRLGRGGFGEVWQAVGPGGFRTAMKFIPMEHKAGTIEMRSLEVMKEIRHPHLLPIFGAWSANGFLIVAMELGTATLLDRLNEVLAEGKPGLPLPELLRHMQDAARGIDYLNSLNIQHRDIKPQNLLLVGGSVKVADFGLARVLEQSIISASGAMTPAYAAPEFLSGQASRWSDQYCLAATYCHLRGNGLPFEGHAAQVITGHLNRVPDLGMLPESERQVVARALAKNPADRWPSCQAFVEALQPVAQGEAPPRVAAALVLGNSATATAPKPFASLPEKRNWSPWWLLGGGVTLLALALLLFLLLWLQPPTKNSTFQATTVVRNEPFIFLQRGSKVPEPPVPQPPAIKTVALKGTVGPQYFQMHGTLVATREINLSAKVNGEVRQVLVQEGTVVKAGQPLLRLDTRGAELDLAKAQAEVDKAKALAEAAQARVVVSRQQLQAQRIRTDEVEINQRALDARQAEVRAAEAGLSKARLRLEDHHMKAPVAGIVTKLDVASGEEIAPSPPRVLVTIAPLDLLQAQADLGRELQRAMKAVPVGMDMQYTVMLNGESQPLATGVTLPSALLASVKLPVPNAQGRLRPGQSVTIRLTVPELKTYTLPKDALIPFRQPPAIRIINREQRVNVVEVTIITQDSKTITVASQQLQEGIQVLVNPVWPVTPSQLLRPFDLP